MIEQSPFTIKDLRKQRKRWSSGLIAVIFHHPASWWTKIILAIQHFAWCTTPFIVLLTLVDMVFYGSYNLLVVRPTFIRVMAYTMDAMAAVMFSVAYTMGIMLLIHKNYVEKFVCFLLIPALIPVMMVMEGSGLVSGLLFPDKTFNLVHKEGMAVKRELTAKNEDETETLIA